MSCESSCHKLLHVRKQTRLPPSGLASRAQRTMAAPASSTPSIHHKSFALVPLKTRDLFLVQGKGIAVNCLMNALWN